MKKPKHLEVSRFKSSRLNSYALNLIALLLLDTTPHQASATDKGPPFLLKTYGACPSLTVEQVCKVTRELVYSSDFRIRKIFLARDDQLLHPNWRVFRSGFNKGHPPLEVLVSPETTEQSAASTSFSQGSASQFYFHEAWFPLSEKAAAKASKESRNIFLSVEVETNIKSWWSDLTNRAYRWLNPAQDEKGITQWLVPLHPPSVQTVRQVPKTYRPKAFQGLVGQYQFLTAESANTMPTFVLKGDGLVDSWHAYQKNQKSAKKLWSSHSSHHEFTETGDFRNSLTFSMQNSESGPHLPLPWGFEPNTGVFYEISVQKK